MHISKINRQEVVNIPSEITHSTYQSFGVGNRQEMLEYIPNTATRVLEVGCGYGNFGALLKQNHSIEVWAVEVNQQVAKIAEQKLDKVICGDFYEAKRLNLPDRYFDCIVFNDVLEHMVDPYSVLLDAKSLLTEEGVIVASIPNVRYISNVYNFLIRQDWEYRDCGILDRTHLRFFTKKTMVKMFANLGYEINLIEGINSMYDRSFSKWSQSKRILFKAIFNLFDLILPRGNSDMKYLQYAVVAKPKNNK